MLYSRTSELGLALKHQDHYGSYLQRVSWDFQLCRFLISHHFVQLTDPT
jgi:hypothetical protein